MSDDEPEVFDLTSSSQEDREEDDIVAATSTTTTGNSSTPTIVLSLDDSPRSGSRLHKRSKRKRSVPPDNGVVATSIKKTNHNSHGHVTTTATRGEEHCTETFALKCHICGMALGEQTNVEKRTKEICVANCGSPFIMFCVFLCHTFQNVNVVTEFCAISSVSVSCIAP